jgi:hypothetical protein
MTNWFARTHELRVHTRVQCGKRYQVALTDLTSRLLWSRVRSPQGNRPGKRDGVGSQFWPAPTTMAFWSALIGDVAVFLAGPTFLVCRARPRRVAILRSWDLIVAARRFVAEACEQRRRRYRLAFRASRDASADATRSREQTRRHRHGFAGKPGEQALNPRGHLRGQGQDHLGPTGPAGLHDLTRRALSVQPGR